MTIKGEWADSSQQIYHVIIEAPWTWEEYRSSADATFSEIERKGGPTALILDVTQSKGFPKGDVMGNLSYIEKHMASNVVASIIVGAPYLWGSFMNIYTRLRPKATLLVHYAKTMDEAHSVAHQQLSQSQLSPSAS